MAGIMGRVIHNGVSPWLNEINESAVMSSNNNDIHVASDARVAAGVCALHSDCGAQLGRILVEQRGDQ